MDEVRHVAKLARLRVDDVQLERYGEQLSAVLDHVAMIGRLDLAGVEPMAHPLDVTNRLDEDEVAPPMAIDDLLRNAPAAEGRFLAVPKVLGDT